MSAIIDSANSTLLRRLFREGWSPGEVTVSAETPDLVCIAVGGEVELSVFLLFLPPRGVPLGGVSVLMERDLSTRDEGMLVVGVLKSGSTGDEGETFPSSQSAATSGFLTSSFFLKSWKLATGRKTSGFPNLTGLVSLLNGSNFSIASWASGVLFGAWSVPPSVSGSWSMDPLLVFPEDSGVYSTGVPLPDISSDCLEDVLLHSLLLYVSSVGYTR